MNKTCPKCWMQTTYEKDICPLCGFDYATGKGGKIADKVLRPPYPYFGSKTKVVHEVWRRFGKVHTFIEPCMGSAAVAINAPYQLGNVILSDLNGYISNFWRAVKAAPEEVAKWADWPIIEADLHARHNWLKDQKARLKALAEGDIREQLAGDPLWYDAKIAGWWAWGASIWLATGWCSEEGRQDGNRPILTKNGGLCGKKPFVQHAKGVNSRGEQLHAYLSALRAKLREAKVCCGDWSRVVTPVCWSDRGATAIFLDPPYSHADRDPTLYGGYDSLLVAKKVRNWAIAHGDNPALRIAVCGYESEHSFPSSWSCFSWVGKRGYTKDGRNQEKERIWFSPHCQQ